MELTQGLSTPLLLQDQSSNSSKQSTDTMLHLWRNGLQKYQYFFNELTREYRFGGKEGPYRIAN